MSSDRTGAAPLDRSIAECLVYADRCRNQGHVLEAEAACRQALEASPGQPAAEHLLGLIAHQRGRLAEAVEFLRRAVRHAPQNALFHSNLGEMLR